MDDRFAVHLLNDGGIPGRVLQGKVCRHRPVQTMFRNGDGNDPEYLIVLQERHCLINGFEVVQDVGQPMGLSEFGSIILGLIDG